jgi:GTP-binding protein
LGIEFLRHIERTGILAHLVEPDPLDGASPLHNYHAVRRELAMYDGRLAERPEIVAVTKADLPSASQARDELARELRRDVLLVSAVTGQGLNQLTEAIVQTLNRRPA